jgi:hypothetical protein
MMAAPNPPTSWQPRNLERDVGRQEMGSPSRER